MRRCSIVTFLSILASMFVGGVSEGHVVQTVVLAKGEDVGAVCVFDDKAGFEKKLKRKSGKIVECEYDCFELTGGATCRSEPCEYVICNQDPWASCSNPTGPEPGILYVTGGAGICDNTGETTGIPGECYFPEAYINCGAPYTCVAVGHGHDYCIYVAPNKDAKPNPSGGKQ